MLYGNDDAIPADAIDYVGASLQITETPTISVANASVVEGNSGTTNMVFTVSLSNVFNQDVTVQFATATPGAGNVATAGVDYQSTSGTLTFAANETTKLVTVAVQGDTTVEPDEIFNLALSNPTNSILGTNSTATGTITNDDFVSSFTIGDVTVTNVTTGTIDAVFTVTLSPGWRSSPRCSSPPPTARPRPALTTPPPAARSPSIPASLRKRLRFRSSATRPRL